MLAGAALRPRRHDGAVLATFVMPMWLVAAGMVLVVGANGALGLRRRVGRRGGAVHAAQSLIVAGLGTLSTRCWTASAWPLVAYCAAMPTACLLGLALLQRGKPPGARTEPAASKRLDQPRRRAIRQMRVQRTGALADRHLVRTIGAGAELDGGRGLRLAPALASSAASMRWISGGVAPQRPPHQPDKGTPNSAARDGEQASSA